MKAKFWLFLIVIGTASRGFAGNSCDAVDLRPSAVPDVQRRWSQALDQGDSGWCYANAAADLLSFYHGHSVSSVQLALAYNDNLDAFDRLARRVAGDHEGPPSSLLDGGRAEVLLDLAQSQFGVCDDVLIPSNSQYRLKSWAARWDKREAEKRDSLLKELERLWPQFKAPVEPRQLSTLRNLTAQDALSRVARKICRLKPIRLSPAEVRSMWHWDGAIVAEVDRAMQSGLPAAVLLESDGIYRADLASIGYFGDHVVTILGRQWNPGRKSCEYLVRDYAGTDCSQYSRTVRCQGDGTFLISTSDLEDLAHMAVWLGAAKSGKSKE